MVAFFFRARIILLTPGIDLKIGNLFLVPRPMKKPRQIYSWPGELLEKHGATRWRLLKMALLLELARAA
ncbi:MAG: hypothetical protein RLZZ581_675 [Actinomycetota bacterium]